MTKIGAGVRGGEEHSDRRENTHGSALPVTKQETERTTHGAGNKMDGHQHDPDTHAELLSVIVPLLSPHRPALIRTIPTTSLFSTVQNYAIHADKVTSGYSDRAAGGRQGWS